jgi:hypothetical protein
VGGRNGVFSGIGVRCCIEVGWALSRGVFDTSF